jgi:DNA-binding HxlR family transcriptional regulator
MDNQGQNQNINTIGHLTKGQNQNPNNVIDFFSYDKGFVYIYKKTEKLATALYMVTNLFGDSEPMKWTLRSKVSNLLSFIISFKNIIQSREEEFSHSVKTSILEIVSLLEICTKSGLVSTMNFTILKSEFIHLIDALAFFKKTEDIAPVSFSFKNDFFNIQSDEKNHNLISRTNEKKEDNLKDRVSLSGEIKKTNRQNIIINLLKKRGGLTIKDIAEVIQNCSEKTIQRELVALIKNGMVKKEGERRWSKYSLLH